jgi:taurine dioxygenase
MDTPISIKRVAGSIGAEVKGVDLKQPLDDTTFATIHKAFLDHCVLVFRRQFLNPAAQMTFAQRWVKCSTRPI